MWGAIITLTMIHPTVEPVQHRQTIGVNSTWLVNVPVLVGSKGFWRLCITLRITEFFYFVHLPEF
jgi:hypothetical protein